MGVFIKRSSLWSTRPGYRPVFHRVPFLCKTRHSYFLTACGEPMYRPEDCGDNGIRLYRKWAEKFARPCRRCYR